METQELNSTLNNLIGHLEINSKEEKKHLDELSNLLSKSSIVPDSCAPVKEAFSFEKSDLYFNEKISKKTAKSIARIIKSQIKTNESPQYRVFKREVPVSNHLIYGSMPTWAVGAKVNKTVGPFIQPDGRNLWFDFYPIQKFSKLYIQGITNPVLLFKENLNEITFANDTISLVRTNNKTFKLTKGSLWINSIFLAPNAPAGSYTGVTIKGGKISLSNTAKIINKKLTVTANTIVTVELNLDQPIANIKPDSTFGIDAREMELALPQKFHFHFSAQGRAIDEVGNLKWKLFGQNVDFNWNPQVQTDFNGQIGQIAIPLQASEPQVEIVESKSLFNNLNKKATIQKSAWVLPVANINLTQSGPASGIGAIWVKAKEGLITKWQGLQNASISLKNPSFLVAPGMILLGDFKASNAHAQQQFDLWKDESNPFGTKVNLTFPDAKPFFYLTNANGNELLMYAANTEFQIDRPVKVDGIPPEIKSLNSLLLVAISDANKLIYLFDDNIILDEAVISKSTIPKKYALALENALFNVSRVNGCLLFGSLADDFIQVRKGFLFLTFRLHRYIPTLPDPYAANLGILKESIRDGFNTASTANNRASKTCHHLARLFNSWLVCRVKWQESIDDEENNNVMVSFHFAPLESQFGGISFEDDQEESEWPAENETLATSNRNASVLSNNNSIKEASYENRNTGTSSSTASSKYVASASVNAAAARKDKDFPPLPNFDATWNRLTQEYRSDCFALLDVSSSADLLGISFNVFQFKIDDGPEADIANLFPVQIKGMEVVSTGANVKTFTVPQISWEPIINLTDTKFSGDPPPGLNYYPDDGGPMQIMNTGEDTVALAPIPLTDYLLKNFEEDTENFKAISFLTLPFGIKALALLENEHSVSLDNGIDVRSGTKFSFNSKDFDNEIKGSRQLQLDAGEAFIAGESNMFVGSTVQLNNVLDFTGNPTGNSTLGRTVTDIFNNEFLLKPFNFIRQRGVPLTRIDLSGYGASTFSNWLNPTASFAKTSQAKFDVIVGRCAHEIIQVVSMIYPWGIKVVRTITIFRVGTGYVYRHDSGWRAESDGRFDFRYFVNIDPDNKIEMPSPFEIHPGIVKGLYNVQNIIETDEIDVVEGQMISSKMVDDKGLYVDNPNAGDLLDYKLQPVYFDADIDIEEVTTGFVEKTIKGEKRKLVSSKKIVGYVQSAPQGIPITKGILRDIVLAQFGAIGGGINCEINLAKSDQKMRLNRFDFNNSFADDGSDIVFALSGRGNVLLPKDGSWSMVKHERDTGDVSPVPSDLNIPVIRKGKVIKKDDDVEIDILAKDALLRIANPEDLLRQPVNETINFGFLQNTDTQKALFLNPSFEWNSKKLNTKVPPLFVDAFRIVNSKGIFPNIGDATNNFGDAVQLLKNNTIPFDTGDLTDLGSAIYQVMDISDTIDNVKQQGYQLIKEGIDKFDLPDTEFNLIDLGEDFRIYIEYKGKNEAGNETKGDLDFNIDSLAQGAIENWKSKMENVALVIDLAGIPRLMRISGSWDSKKGSEASYPKPKLEFSEVLQPVIDILEILQQLQGGNYADAVASGLKLAMSNKAGSWEYKFEASKEIPVLRFPVPDAVYNDPNTPLKLEAGLKIGAYFNAALEISGADSKLLPSAGGFLGFYGRLSVMCVSLSAATIYAIGQVNLDIAADTKIGPSLRMKFGFGAQIVVGLPVAGNVSVLFVVGVEIFAASGQLDVTASLLFEGHAEILGGIVSITIRIEALGTVSRKTLPSGEDRTDMACQVTFGLDISIAFIINISFSESWQEQRQIA